LLVDADYGSYPSENVNAHRLAGVKSAINRELNWLPRPFPEGTIVISLPGTACITQEVQSGEYLALSGADPALSRRTRASPPKSLAGPWAPPCAEVAVLLDVCYSGHWGCLAAGLCSRLSEARYGLAAPVE